MTEARSGTSGRGDGGAPTLEDVAVRAGVSTATVSRCLNRPEQVIADTRERVLRAVRELGYAPNFGARALVAGRTRTIGAIIPTMENAVFAQGIQAFQEALGQAGYTLLVASSSYDPALEAEQIRSLVARGADGLLLIGYDRDAEAYRFLRQQSVPVMVAWAYDPAEEMPSIGFDNRSAMRGLTARAIALGHREIAVISAPTATNDRARNRVLGVEDALRNVERDPAVVSVTEVPYGTTTGAEAFGAIMRRQPRPTLVICGNDVLAAGALKRAQEMGLSVPGDVSITGFDDIELARLVTPELTTVSVPHREMGRTAAMALIEMVEGRGPIQSLSLPTSIREGGSLGPAPG